MKPDLGLQLLRDGIDQDIELHFYGVTFQSIDFLAPNSFAARVNRDHLGTIHTATFEFDDEIMVSLLSRLPGADRQGFAARSLDRCFPFSEGFPVPVKLGSIECRIGSVQHNATEPFVPLRIVAVE